MYFRKWLMLQKDDDGKYRKYCSLVCKVLAKYKNIVSTYLHIHVTYIIYYHETILTTRK